MHTATETDKVREADLEILEATIEALTSAVPVGMNPTKTAASAGKLGKALLTQPRALARQTLGLSGELVKIAAGTTDVDPSADRRFADETYSKNPIYRRIAQTYLAGDRSIGDLLDDLDLDAAGNVARRALEVDRGAEEVVDAGLARDVEVA